MSRVSPASSRSRICSCVRNAIRNVCESYLCYDARVGGTGCSSSTRWTARRSRGQEGIHPRLLGPLKGNRPTSGPVDEEELTSTMRSEETRTSPLQAVSEAQGSSVSDHIAHRYLLRGAL